MNSEFCLYTQTLSKDKCRRKMLNLRNCKSAIKINPNNDNAYVEAAHSLGRYGQKIGIMAAITTLQIELKNI